MSKEQQERLLTGEEVDRLEGYCGRVLSMSNSAKHEVLLLISSHRAQADRIAELERERDAAENKRDEVWRQLSAATAKLAVVEGRARDVVEQFRCEARSDAMMRVMDKLESALSALATTPALVDEKTTAAIAEDVKAIHKKVMDEIDSALSDPAPADVRQEKQ